MGRFWDKVKTGIQNTGRLVGAATGWTKGNKELSDQAREATDAASKAVEDYQKQEEQKAAQQAEDTASSDAGIAAQQEAVANATNARNAGVSSAGAALVGNTAASKDSTQAQITGANQANKASTQADWLASQGYLQQMQNNYNNEKKGRLWSTIGGTLSGIGSGAQLGNAVSDETEKCTPSETDISDADLYDKIDKFMDLYKQLQELKGGKE